MYSLKSAFNQAAFKQKQTEKQTEYKEKLRSHKSEGLKTIDSEETEQVKESIYPATSTNQVSETKFNKMEVIKFLKRWRFD